MIEGSVTTKIGKLRLLLPELKEMAKNGTQLIWVKNWLETEKGIAIDYKELIKAIKKISGCSWSELKGNQIYREVQSQKKQATTDGTKNIVPVQTKKRPDVAEQLKNIPKMETKGDLRRLKESIVFDSNVDSKEAKESLKQIFGEGGNNESCDD